MLDPKTLGTAFDFWALGFASLGSFLLLSLHVFCSCHHARPKSPRNSLRFLGPWLRFFGELFVAVSACFFRQSTWRCSNSPRKKSREFPPVCECFLVLVTDASVGRVLGGAQIVPAKNRESFLLSKNVCWCWLRMLLLAESVPATMLDPKALGTALTHSHDQ